MEKTNWYDIPADARHDAVPTEPEGFNAEAARRHRNVALAFPLIAVAGALFTGALFGAGWLIWQGVVHAVPYVAEACELVEGIFPFLG